MKRIPKPPIEFEMAMLEKEFIEHLTGSEGHLSQGSPWRIEAKRLRKDERSLCIQRYATHSCYPEQGEKIFLIFSKAVLIKRKKDVRCKVKGYSKGHPSRLLEN